MRVDRVLDMARRLAREEDLEGLRLLLRMSALPLQAEALLGWAGRELPRRLEDALPRQVAPRLQGEEEEVLRPVALGEATAVVSFPWNPDRMERAFREIAPGRWRYDRMNHFCVLYRPLGMVFFQNGMHSGAIGALKGEGAVVAQEVNLGRYFDAGLQVEAREGGLWAVNEWTKVAAPFPHPAYGLLWGLACVLWEEGVEA